VAVVINPEELEDYIEIKSEEASPAFKKQLLEGKKEYEIGKTKNIDEIKKLL